MHITAYKAIIADGMADDLQNFLKGREAYVKRAFFETDKIMNANLFQNKNEVYIYIESIDGEMAPGILFDGIQPFLLDWPEGDDKKFRRMTSIFHFNEPQSVSHWRRKTKPDYCFGMIANVIPDLIARYVFYHYQFQEEQPGSGDKYGRIFLSGDNAFYYGEIPELYEPALYDGALKTHNTPEGEQWQKIMGSHFIWWDETYPACDVRTYDWKKNGYPTGQRNHQWLYLKNIFSVV